jgi:hypothetical protein
VSNFITKLRGIPIWVSVPAIIALVLVGVVVSSMLLGSISSDGQGGNSSQMGGTNHTGAHTGTMVPSASQSAGNPTPFHHPVATSEGGLSNGPAHPTATPSHGSGHH